MNNCLFNKFKDLVGIHQIVFDSALADPTPGSAIAGLKAAKYFDEYQPQIATANEVDANEFLNDVTSAIEMAFEIMEEFVDENDDLPGIDDLKSFINATKSYNVGANIHLLFQDMDFKFANPQSMKDALVLPQNNEERVPNTISNADVFLKTDRDTLIDSAVSETLNLNVQNVYDLNDVVNNYYKGASSAFEDFKRLLRREIFDSVMLKTNLEKHNTGEKLNQRVREVKDRLYKALTLNNTAVLYGEDYNVDKLQDAIAEAHKSFSEFDNGAMLTVGHLMNWSQSNSPIANLQLNRYNAMVALKHFDDLINEFSNRQISVGAGKNIETDADKYRLNKTTNVASDWTSLDSDASGLDAASDAYKTILGTTKILDLNGNETNEILPHVQVNYSFSKIIKSVQIENVGYSVRKTIIDTLRDYYNTGVLGNNVDKQDLRALLTLYDRVYRNNSAAVEELGSNSPYLTNANLKAPGRYSIFDSYKDYDQMGLDGLNYLNVVGVNLMKIDTVNYTEVVYDSTEKTLMFRSFLNKEANMQRNTLKQLGFTAMLNPQLFKSQKDKYGFNISKNSVNYILADGKVLEYNTKSFTYTLHNGGKSTKLGTKELHKAIKVPASNVTIGSIQNFQTEYPDYYNIIKMHEEILEQPLSVSNYKLLDAMRDAMDVKSNPAGHLDNILGIMSNGLFIRALDSVQGGLNGNVNASIKEIENKINAGLKTLGESTHTFSEIWDDNKRRYRIELSRAGDLNFQRMQDYARVLNDFFNTRTRSVTINSEGNAVSTYRLMSMINRYNSIQDQVSKQYDNDYGVNPLRKNIFVKNPKLIKTIEINSGFRLNDAFSSSGAMSFDELVNARINANFIPSLAKGREGLTLFQPAEYADKGTHSQLGIERKENITYIHNGETKKINLHTASSTTIRGAYFETQYEYYKDKVDGIKNQFLEVLENTVGPSFMFEAFMDNTKYLGRYLDAIADADPDSVLNAKAESLSNKEKLTDQEVVLAKEIDTYFRLKSPLSLATKSDPAEFNKLLKGVSAEVARQAFNNANVVYTKHETFENFSDPDSIELNVSLVNNLKQFKNGSPENLKYIKDVEQAFLDKIITSKVTIDLYNSNGEENVILNKAIEALPAADKSVFDRKLTEISPGKMVNLTAFTNLETGRLEPAIYNEDGSIKALNPIYSKFLWESNLISRNFHELMVGAPSAHPHKIKKPGSATNWQVDAARLGAQNKRMVALQATIQQALNNTIDGINSASRVFTISDVGSKVFSAYGKNDSVDVTDGSTFILPSHAILFNNSLVDQRGGWTLKSIRPELDPKTGVAKLLKHAAHSITNRNVKAGYKNGENDYLSLIQKGLSFDFVNIKYGKQNSQVLSLGDLDITKNFLGLNSNILNDNPLQFTMPIEKHNRIQALQGQPYNSLITVLSIIKQPEANTYQVTYKNETTGQEIKDIQTFTNSWDLWNALGAENSVELKESEKGKFSETRGTVLDGYLPSMTSWEVLTKFMNNVGITTDKLKESNPEFYDHYHSTYLHSVLETPLEEKIYDQTNVFQPMKFTHVGEFVFESAYKVGPQNILKMNDIRSPKSNLPFSIANNTIYGLQLDAGHDVDGSSVTEQTQIISALDFVGDTPETALSSYMAISTYVSNSLANLLPSISQYTANVEDTRKVREIIRKILITSLDAKDITGIDTALVEILKAEVEKGELPTFKIPLSSPDFYNSVVTAFGNFFTKQGIRRKLAGIGAVLKPYSSFMNFHEIYKDGQIQVVSSEEYDKHKSKNPGENILTYDKKQAVTLKSTVVEYEKVPSTDGTEDSYNEVGRHYLDTLSKYYDIKSKMLAQPDLFRLDVEAARDLRGSDHEIVINGTNYSYLDLPVNLLANLNSTYANLTDKLKAANDQLELAEAINEDLGLNNDTTMLNARVLQLTSEIASLSTKFEETKLKVTGTPVRTPNGSVTYVLPESIKNITVSDNLNKNPKVLQILKNLSTRDHKLLHHGYSRIPALASYDDYADMEIYHADTLQPLGKVSDYAPSINELPIVTALNAVVKIENHTARPAEGLAPNVHLSAFGLSELHTPNNVTIDTFYDILNMKNTVLTNDYDAVLKSMKGPDLHIVYKGSETHNKLINSGTFTLNNSLNISNIHGKNYIVNRYGEPEQMIPGDKIYTSISNYNNTNYVVVDRDNENLYSNIFDTIDSEGSLFYSFEPNFEKVDELHNDFYRAKQANLFNYGEDILKRATLFASPEAAINANIDVAELLLKDDYGKMWVADEIKSLVTYFEKEGVKPKFLLERLGVLHELQSALENPENDFKITMAFTKVNQSLAFSGSKIKRYQKDLDLLRNTQREIEAGKKAKNKELARRLHASFINSLRMSAARIPGQHLQSWMGMKIVAFTNDEMNISYLPPEHMWITGEDFDIDKAYLSMYVLGNDSRIARWTKFWADDSVEKLEVSLTLPMVSPNANASIINMDTLQFKSKPSIAAISDEEVATVLANQDAIFSNNADGITLEDFKLIRNFLNKVFVNAAQLSDSDSTTKNLYTRNPQPKSVQDALSKVIDQYFNNTFLTSDLSKTGSLNAIVAGMINTGVDIRNMNTQMSPVDFGESGNLADTSPKGKAMQNLSPDNPLDIDFVQVSAMFGKDVIGIAATGLKGYGIIAHLQSRIKSTGVGPALFFDKASEDLGDYVKSYVETVNIDNEIELDNIAQWIINHLEQYWGLPEADVQTVQLNIDELKAKIQDRNYNRYDIALEFSAILSAATDNAKEMILGRINAGPETASLYLAGSLAGKSMSDIFEYMTSDEAEAIIAYNTRNLFKGKKMSYKAARNKLIGDRFTIKDYMQDFQSQMYLSAKLFKFDNRQSGQNRYDTIKDENAIFITSGNKKVRLDHYLALNGKSLEDAINIKKGGREDWPAEVLTAFRNEEVMKVVAFLKNPSRAIDAYLRLLPDGTISEAQSKEIFKDLMTATAVGVDQTAVSDATDVYKKPKRSPQISEYDQNEDEEPEDDNDYYDENDISNFYEEEENGEEHYEEYEEDDSGMSNPNNAKANAKVNKIIYNFGRAVYDYRDSFAPARKAILERTSKEIENPELVNFTDLDMISSDLSLIGKLGGANQGLKVRHEDSLGYIKSIYNYMEDNFAIDEDPVLKADFESTSPVELVDLYFNDSAFRARMNDKFVSPGLFQELNKRLESLPDDGDKPLPREMHSKVNVLEIITSVPHMNALINLAVKNHLMMNKTQLKSRFIDYMLSKNKFMNADNYRVVNNYVNDLLISLGLRHLPENLRTITLRKGDSAQITDTSITDNIPYTELATDRNIDLGSPDGRLAFMTWFEATVIPNLKRGEIRNADGTYTYNKNQEVLKNEQLLNNEFIKYLTTDTKSDPYRDEYYGVYTIRVNNTARASIEEKNLIEKLKTSFANLKDVVYDGKKLTDLFFVYNLLAYKGLNTKGSLSFLLNSVSSSLSDTDSILSSYYQILGELDMSTEFTGANNYNADDLIIRGLNTLNNGINVSKPTGPWHPYSISQTKRDEDGRYSTRYYKQVVNEKNEEEKVWMEVKSNHSNKILNIRQEGDVKEVYAESAKKAMQRRKLSRILSNFVEIIETNC